MNISLLGMLMLVCWGIALLGGLGAHVLSHFNGRRLEAYCRLRRRPERFGQILDGHEQAATAAQYVMLFALVIGSLAAGAWFTTSRNFGLHGERISGDVGFANVLGWVLAWLLLLTLAGLWLPRIVVHYSSSLFVYHSWPLWNGLSLVVRPFLGAGNVFSWLGRRLSDEPDSEDHDEEVLEDEIRTMVAAGQRDGVFSEGIPEMIQGVMDLDEADVEEIMTPRSLVDAIDVDSQWGDVLAKVADCGRTRIPIFENTLDNVIGILFVKDLLPAFASDTFQPGPDTLRGLLRKPWFIPVSKPVDELLRVFLHNRNHMAIVVDEYQQFAGVVTIEDALEEIVGEIADELDTEEDSEIVYDEDSHQIEAQGKVPIESLSKLLGVELPESDDYDTIGGLVIHRLSQIPPVGTQVDVANVRITVVKATQRAIQKVRLEMIGLQAESGLAKS